MAKKNNSPVTETVEVDSVQTEPKEAKIESLLNQLGKVPKGERSNGEAKKLRRSLRKLGYYISKIKPVEQEAETVEA